MHRRRGQRRGSMSQGGVFDESWMGPWQGEVEAEDGDGQTVERPSLWEAELTALWEAEAAGEESREGKFAGFGRATE
jgi:hypothetical protein